jgi:MFS family permease
VADARRDAGLRLPVLTGMLLATALAPLGSTMIAVALPSIGRDLGAEVPILTPWLVSSYLIAGIALQSPGGKLGDLLGHVRALCVGLSLVAAGSVLGSLSEQLYALGLARVLMASGGAATVPATMAILRNQTPPGRRTRVFGLFGASMSLAAAIGPLVGGELTERLGWRSVFAANLPVVALSLLLVLTASRESFTGAPAVDRRPSFDVLGSGLLACGLTLAIVAIRLPASAAVWLAVASAALLLAFPWWEQRVPSPVVDFSLFRHAAFVGGGAIVALQNMALYPLLFQMPVFFERVRGLGTRATGYLLLSLTFAMMLGSVGGGWLSERIGARAQAFAGSLCALAGLWWFTDLSAVRVPGQLLPGMVALGAGIGLTTPPAQAASMSAVERERSGMAGGVLATMRYVGGVAGTGVLSAMLGEPTSASAHQRPIVIYAAALAAAAALSATLPARARPVLANVPA